jgi:hypothetical protein
VIVDDIYNLRSVAVLRSKQLSEKNYLQPDCKFMSLQSPKFLESDSPPDNNFPYFKVIK